MSTQSPSPEMPEAPQAFQPDPAPQPAPAPAPQAAPAPSAAYGTPNAPMGQMPHIPQMPQLPSRTGGIISLVCGLATMLILAPIAFVLAAAIGSAASLSTQPDLSPDLLVTSVAVGEQLTVDSTGLVTLETSFDNPTLPQSCQLESATETYPLISDTSNGTLNFNGFGIPEGTYTLTCSPASTTGNVYFQQFQVGSLLSIFGGGLLIGLIAGTVVGFIGLVLTIFGIVRIVRVNKRRRELMSHAGF